MYVQRAGHGDERLVAPRRGHPVCARGVRRRRHAVRKVQRVLAAPRGSHIDPRAAAVHGITAATLDAQGRPAGGEVRTLRSRLQDLRTRGVPIVAHNAASTAHLRQTAEAHGADWDLAAEDVFCVMRAAKPILQLPASNGRPKAPTNVECCFHGAHPIRAWLASRRDDVRAHAAARRPCTARCPRISRVRAQGRDDHCDGLPRGAHPRVVAMGLGRPRTKTPRASKPPPMLYVVASGVLDGFCATQRRASLGGSTSTRPPLREFLTLNYKVYG